MILGVTYLLNTKSLAAEKNPSKGVYGPQKNFKKPSVEEFKKKLTDLQFRVTQQKDTETSFKNLYHDNKKAGYGQYVKLFQGKSIQKLQIARSVREFVNRSGKWKNKVVTEIVPAGKFTRAEDYHQDYLIKKPDGYTCHYLRE